MRLVYLDKSLLQLVILKDEVIQLQQNKLMSKLIVKETNVTLENIAQNSKAGSGGERDLNFLKYLVDNNLLDMREAFLKRTSTGAPEEYFLDRYKKMSYESDRHFLCRTMIQDELMRMGINAYSDMTIGDMNILRANSSYDIMTDDFKTLIDVGLTPARNFFRGLTDTRVENYLITTYFDDYMDDIVFAVFNRVNDGNFISAVKDYEEGFKMYIPNPQEKYELPMADI